MAFIKMHSAGERDLQPSQTSTPNSSTAPQFVDPNSPDLLYSALSKDEKWGLEGYIQLAYSLATISLSKTETESSLWEVHSPLLVSTFYRVVSDTANFPLKHALIAALENCKKAFGKFYNWREETLVDIFTPQTTGKAALVEILELVMLSKSYGTTGEEWWELRRNFCVAFFDAFQRHGWIARDASMFQRLFKEGICIIRGVGSSPLWVYALLGDLKDWRFAKDAQEAVVMERIKNNIQKRANDQVAWKALKETVGTERMNSISVNTTPLAYSFLRYHYEEPVSPGTLMREAERRKPLQLLQQRLAPSTQKYTTRVPSKSRNSHGVQTCLKTSLYHESTSARPMEVLCEPYVHPISGSLTTADAPFIMPHLLETGLISPASSCGEATSAAASVSDVSPTNLACDSRQGTTKPEVRHHEEPMDVDFTNSAQNFEHQLIDDSNVDEVGRLMEMSDEEEFWESFTNISGDTPASDLA